MPCFSESNVLVLMERMREAKRRRVHVGQRFACGRAKETQEKTVVVTSGVDDRCPSQNNFEKECVELLTRVDSVRTVLSSGTKTLTGDTKMNEAQTAAAKLIEAGEVVGFRFVDHAVEVGQYLDNSFVWDGDEKTDTELPGTCAFESWSTFAKYAQYSRGCGKCVVITGSSKGRGTDFAGEIYVGDAVVVAVMEW